MDFKSKQALTKVGLINEEEDDNDYSDDDDDEAKKMTKVSKAENNILKNSNLKNQKFDLKY